MPPKFTTVDEYVRSLPDDRRVVAEELRRRIRVAVPEATETVQYQMPTIVLDGTSLVHFAVWQHHIGLYPLPPADEALEPNLAPYRTAKGIGNFPLREPIPYDLIEQVVALLAERRARPEE